MTDQDDADCSLGSSVDLFEETLAMEDERDGENGEPLSKTETDSMTLNDSSGLQSHSADGGKETEHSNHVSSADKETFGKSSIVGSELNCPFCPFSDPDLHRLQFHVDVEHSDGAMAFQASGSSECLLETGESLRRAHLNSSHHKPSNLLNSDFCNVCPFCDLYLENGQQLTRHIHSVHNEDGGKMFDGQDLLTCLLCGRTFVCNEDMQEHLDVHALQEDPNFCVATSPVSLDLICPVCHIHVENSDLLSRHVEMHFSSEKPIDVDAEYPPPQSESREMANGKSEQPNAEQLSGPSRQLSGPSKGGNSSKYNKQYHEALERDVLRGIITPMEYHELKSHVSYSDKKGHDDGTSRVEGLIEVLHGFYHDKSRPGQNVTLCDPTDHFSSCHGDRGWGCGYRNFQMLLSSLAKHQPYASLIFKDGEQVIPSISKLQKWIEWAWSKGFDRIGCSQLGGHLDNTDMWIGATEIVATLSAMGIKCQLVDFHAPSSEDGTHPRLFEWVMDYFKRSDGPKPPLYLQHQGHSRSIIGVEQEGGISRLLLFDPSTPKSQLTSIKTGNLAWKDLKTFRRTLSGFKARQYQIVAVVGLLDEQEYEERKVIGSIRVS